jgi:hypothetical protein
MAQSGRLGGRSMRNVGVEGWMNQGRQASMTEYVEVDMRRGKEGEKVR